MTRDRIVNAIALLIVLCIGVAFLAACTTTGTPKVETQIVNVPIPVPCKPDLGPEPDYPDTAAALVGVTDIFAGVQLLKAGRLMRIAREAELLAALKACSGP